MIIVKTSSLLHVIIFISARWQIYYTEARTQYMGFEKCQMWMLGEKHVIVTARSRGDDDDVFSGDRGWLWWKLIGSSTILARWAVIPSYLNGQPQHCSVKITQTRPKCQNQTSQIASIKTTLSLQLLAKQCKLHRWHNDPFRQQHSSFLFFKIHYDQMIEC